MSSVPTTPAPDQKHSGRPKWKATERALWRDLFGTILDALMQDTLARGDEDDPMGDEDRERLLPEDIALAARLADLALQEDQYRFLGKMKGRT